MSDTPTPRTDAMRKHVFGEQVWVTVEECKALETALTAHREALREAEAFSEIDPFVDLQAWCEKRDQIQTRIQSILKTTQAEETK